jgi:hypothetical protein
VHQLARCGQDAADRFGDIEGVHQRLYGEPSLTMAIRFSVQARPRGCSARCRTHRGARGVRYESVEVLGCHYRRVARQGLALGVCGLRIDRWLVDLTVGDAVGAGEDM